MAQNLTRELPLSTGGYVSHSDADLLIANVGGTSFSSQKRHATWAQDTSQSDLASWCATNFNFVCKPY